jgi:predicted GIY-YIG superfamily endonuclease
MSKKVSNEIKTLEFPEDTKPISCIYLIYDIDGKIYVGETSNFKERLKSHRKYNYNLLDSNKSYSIESFKYEILEVMENSTRLERLPRERFFQDKYNVLGELGRNQVLEPLDKNSKRIYRPEVTKKRLRSLSETIYNRSDERKEEIRKVKSEANKLFQANISCELKLKISKNISKGLNNRSQYEKELHIERFKESYYSRPEEEREETRNKISKSRSIQISIDNVQYPNIKTASNILKCCNKTIRFRLDSSDYPNYIELIEREKSSK